jgi:geranyl-CoA carboxylase alpha subunit
MGEAAVNAAAAIGYVGAGTVEFLLGEDGAFYFMEMNTRLQVEHPVTEWITGQDLVAWQLKVAAGEPLPLAQDSIAFHGHAIEVRLCTEDTAQGFLPQTGDVLAWRPPTGPGVLVDHGLIEGQAVTPYYDSMQAKIVAWGADRREARRRLIRALDQCVLLGLPSNRDFLARVLRHSAFASGEFDTGFIENHFPASSLRSTPDKRHWALAAAIFYNDDACALRKARGFDPGLIAWRNSHRVPVPMKLRCGDDEQHVTLRANNMGDYAITVGGDALQLTVTEVNTTNVTYCLEGVRQSVSFARDSKTLFLAAAGSTFTFADALLEPPQTALAGNGQLTAPMAGRILAVN